MTMILKYIAMDFEKGFEFSTKGASATANSSTLYDLSQIILNSPLSPTQCVIMLPFSTRFAFFKDLRGFCLHLLTTPAICIHKRCTWWDSMKQWTFSGVMAYFLNQFEDRSASNEIEVVWRPPTLQIIYVINYSVVVKNISENLGVVS